MIDPDVPIVSEIAAPRPPPTALPMMLQVHDQDYVAHETPFTGRFSRLRHGRVTHDHICRGRSGRDQPISCCGGAVGVREDCGDLAPVHAVSIRARNFVHGFDRKGLLPIAF
jgi:hypothetical protein